MDASHLSLKMTLVKTETSRPASLRLPVSLHLRPVETEYSRWWTLKRTAAAQEHHLKRCVNAGCRHHHLKHSLDEPNCQPMHRV
eukprot:588411-Amphidinium_carterae.1